MQPITQSLFPELLVSEQFRMTQLQVFNWGTFSGLHRIPIAREGFLFVGRSGSGKSTLLDALSALLVPPQWRGFNAAARDGDKGKHDRNLALYVRGAFGDQTDNSSGEIATQYLRTGTTWSAIALEYQNAENKIITLISLFSLRGEKNSTSEVHTHYMIAERSFDIASELSDFNLDIRKLKIKLSSLFHADSFRAYSERFRLLLNINSEMALKLLHKTQSAKNLGDLNLFLREYMLDEPETFSVADRLVTEFSELDAAHKTVVTAREQVETLMVARVQYHEMKAHEIEISQLDELRLGIDNYCTQQQKILLKTEINRLDTQIAGITGQVKQEQEILDEMRSQLRRLESQHRNEGGERVEILKEELNRAEQNKIQRIEKRACVSEVCQKLKKMLPDTAQAYAEFINESRDFNESWQRESETYEKKRDELRDLQREVTAEFTFTRQEIESMKRQPSNIPARMLALRQKIIEQLRLSESDLPFAGELIEVREDAALWRGSIERVLHGFALSILVNEKHYAMVSGFVNEASLGSRLVYYRLSQNTESHAMPIASHSLINKLNLKKGNYFDWLDAEIKRRFNYLCVDSLQEFRKTDRALTREGQIRHGKSQHEKDDRNAIDEKKYWVLGFDNLEKLRLFEQRAQALAEKLAACDKELQSIQEVHQQKLQQAMAYQSIINITWNEIDIASVLNTIAGLEKELNELLKHNAVLKDIGEKILLQQKKISKKEADLNKINVNLEILNTNIKTCRDDLSVLNEKIITPLTPYQSENLNKRFEKEGKLTLQKLPHFSQKVEREITFERETLQTKYALNQNEIEKTFQRFKNRWPQDAAECDASIFSVQEFLAKLARLERDGLPAHEERFFTMLRNQSMENLAALNTHLSQARKDIFNRMEMVNESLAAAQYNPGTHLKIEASDKQLETVKNFRQGIRDVLSHAWSDDRELAEKRFAALRSLVEQLSGNESEHQRFRQQMLDVRLHVEFLAREFDADGKEIEVYRSGAGKSGGQREKLATTCLAAALCYQLGGQQQGVPLYAPVVLDEAFSKADNEFTQEVMKVFIKFGFQMIVATPFKSVMTLEPFIAGACLVDITDRKHSRTLQIHYNQSENRLDLPEVVA
jgi:uncharacterized protein YPO0396